MVIFFFLTELTRSMLQMQTSSSMIQNCHNASVIPFYLFPHVCSQYILFLLLHLKYQLLLQYYHLVSSKSYYDLDQLLKNPHFSTWLKSLYIPFLHLKSHKLHLVMLVTNQFVRQLFYKIPTWYRRSLFDETFYEYNLDNDDLLILLVYILHEKDLHIYRCPPHFPLHYQL